MHRRRKGGQTACCAAFRERPHNQYDYEYESWRESEISSAHFYGNSGRGGDGTGEKVWLWQTETPHGRSLSLCHHHPTWRRKLRGPKKADYNNKEYGIKMMMIVLNGLLYSAPKPWAYGNERGRRKWDECPITLEESWMRDGEYSWEKGIHPVWPPPLYSRMENVFSPLCKTTNGKVHFSLISVLLRGDGSDSPY